jgi:two-component system response regulator HydG
VKSIAPVAAERLLVYRWPGNVRELQNCMERAVALATHDWIGVDDLPDCIRDAERESDSDEACGDVQLLPLDEIERQHVLRVLDAVRGNRTAAAQVLGFDRKTLYRKLRRYGHAG